MIKAQRDLTTEDGVHVDMDTDDIHDMIREFAAVVAQMCVACEDRLVDGTSPTDFVRLVVDIGINAYKDDRRAAQDGD